MARDTGIKKCKYSKCKHDGSIDINSDEFVKEGNNYFHKDCHQEKSDLQLFRNIWVQKISATVVHSQLNKILSQLISNGVSSDYMLFTLQYVIDHKKNLSYPSGFRYYLDYPEIKTAYEKAKVKKVVETADFTVKEAEDTAPKFSINKKPSGFQSILKSKVTYQ